jgi:hypothetical protein
VIVALCNLASEAPPTLATDTNNSWKYSQS